MTKFLALDITKFVMKPQNYLVQSICTHYSCLKIWVGYEPEKNQVQNMDLKKVGCKNMGHCYPKREEARLPIPFLNNNDLVFSHPGFFRSIQTLKIFRLN